MLQQEVQKALHEGRQTPPEGFEARSDAQLLRLTAEKRPSGRRFPRAAVVLCTLLLVLGIATGLAATVEAVNDKLYQYWPELAEVLMPVNTGCEKLGIRMEVESAVVQENKVMVVYSMQDLEGDRLNEYSQAAVSETAIQPNGSATPENIGSTSLLLSYDQEAKKATFAQEIEYDRPVKGTNEKIRLAIPYLFLEDQAVTDLHPILEAYRGNPAVIPASEADVLRYASRSGNVEKAPEGLKLLDHTKNPEIPIHEHAAISGIGWIDGTLHVQVHHINNDMVQDGEGENGYYPVYCHIMMQLADGWSPWARYSDNPDAVLNGVYCVLMGSNEDMPEWSEYIFPCEPSEVPGAKLEAQVRLSDSFLTLQGFWTVSVPLSMIRYE